MRKLVRFLSLSLAIACQPQPPSDLTIAVASNMHFTIAEMVRVFEQQNNTTCNLVVSSSGKLTAQIKQGAPFDLLISADMKYPQELYKSGLTTTNPEVYGYGKLVLATAVTDPELELDILTSSNVKHIAVANPKTAPYGKAAIETLEYHGVLDSIQHKLVFGESISQVNQFVISGAVEVGFTAKSVVLSKQLQEKVHWKEIDELSYKPMAQGLVVIRSRNITMSQKFRDFMFSNEGREVLHKYGFALDELLPSP